MESLQNTRKKDLERAEVLLEQAKPKADMDDYDAPTVAALKEAMGLFEKWEVEEKIAEAYYYWGEYQGFIQKSSNAIDFYQKSLSMRLKLSGKRQDSVWELYSSIHDTYMDVCNYKDAKLYLDKAMNLGTILYSPTHLNIGKNYHRLGTWYFNCSYFVKAIENFNKAMNIIKIQAPPPKDLLLQLYSNLAVSFVCIHNYEKAIYYYQASLCIAQEIPASRDLDSEIGIVYMNYSSLYRKLGDWNRALLYGQKAIDIFESINEVINTAYAYQMMMGVYLSEREYDKVIEQGEKVLKLLKKNNIEVHRGVLVIYRLLGKAYIIEGHSEKAYTCCEHVISISKKLWGETSSLVSHGMTSMAYYYFKEEMFDKTEECLRAALALLENGDRERRSVSRSLAYVWQIRATMYEKTQQWTLALKAHQKALIACTFGYEEEDIYDYPFFDLRSSDFEIGHDYHRWLTYVQSKANAFFQLYRSQTHDLIDLQAAFRGYKIVFHFLDQIQQSFQSEISKIFIINYIQEELIRSVAIIYQFFIINQDFIHSEKIFEFIEKCKGYLLLNNKQEKIAKQIITLPVELLEQEQQLQSKLTMLQKNIQSQKQKGEKANQEQLQIWENNYFHSYNEFEELRKRLETDCPDYYRLKYSTATVSLKQLQQALTEQQVVLNYFISEKKIFLFAITADEYEIFATDKPSNWTALIQNHLQSIKLHQKAQFLQCSFELYQILLQEAIHHLIDPFADEDEQRQIFIIPHAELHYLPFETLIISEVDSSIPYQDLDYLLKHCQISYHYSATLLHFDLQKHAESAAERAPVDVAFTGFAPIYASSSNAQKQALELLQTKYTTAANRSEAVRNDGTWMPLPYSKLEVENIARLFEQQGLQSQSFLYESANKSNLEAQISKSRFVLIAAHGIVNNEYPELSGLVLAADGSGSYQSETTKDLEFLEADRDKIKLQKATDNCILNMKEVTMMPMNADLVVLSSCESGIGELHKGEGMMAVNRGFLASGAKNVVSTLFKVNDLASSELTQLLFRYILEGENYATALQKAKLDLLSGKGMSPKSWSGFVLFGVGVRSCE